MTSESPSASESQPSTDTRPCPMCAEAIRREALKCRFCGHILDAVAAAKVSDRVNVEPEAPRGSASAGEPVAYEVVGRGGQVRLTRKRVIISRKGAIGFLAHGLKGDKEIPIPSITAIQFKSASDAVNGYIQFTLTGGVESRGGLFAATHDENSVFFEKAEEARFRELKRYIDAVIDGAPVAFETLDLPRAGDAATPALAPKPPASASKAPATASPNAIEVSCPSCGVANTVYPKNLRGPATCRACGTKIPRETWETPASSMGMTVRDAAAPTIAAPTGGEHAPSTPARAVNAPAAPARPAPPPVASHGVPAEVSAADGPQPFSRQNVPNPATGSTAPPPQKMTCVLLALFVPFGLHRYQMGYSEIAIAQAALTVFTCGLAALWPWADALLILGGKLKCKDGRDPIGDSLSDSRVLALLPVAMISCCVFSIIGAALNPSTFRSPAPPVPTAPATNGSADEQLEAARRQVEGQGRGAEPDWWKQEQEDARRHREARKGMSEADAVLDRMVEEAAKEQRRKARIDAHRAGGK